MVMSCGRVYAPLHHFNRGLINEFPINPQYSECSFSFLSSSPDNVGRVVSKASESRHRLLSMETLMVLFLSCQSGAHW